MHGRSLGAIVAALLLVNAPVSAHGFHAAFTIIDADAHGRRLHVVHRMFTQDVDTLIKARTNAAVTVRSGPAFDAAIETYLRTAFTLRDDAGAALPLTLSRVAVADDLVVAYFEATSAAAPQRLIVDSQLLMETNPDQVNTVNVTVNGETRTVVFRDGDAPHPVRFN